MFARFVIAALLCALFSPPNGRAQSSAAGSAGSSWDLQGDYEVKFDFRKNFDLHRRDRDDLLRFDQELQLRWLYRPSDAVSLFIEGKILGEHQLYTGRGGRRSEFDPERGESWIRFDNLFGEDLSLKLGRQNFAEPRRWWWDDDLDAASARYRHAAGFFELGLGRELPRKSLRVNFADPENEGVFRALGRAHWLYNKNHSLDLFFLHHNDRSVTQSVGARVKIARQDPSDARLWWGGMRAAGDEPLAKLGELSYWADLAMVSGREKLLEFDDPSFKRVLVTARRKQRVRGWAVDVGGRWQTQLPAEPMFSLGYAFGSGDKNSADSSDRAFRQTGLESNDEEFRTYGELLRPELSNLRIPFVAVRFPVLSRSHLEFTYRHFRQVHASPSLRSARIDAEPNGIHKNIGQEWMLYALLKQWKNFEVELVGAAFRAGHAYGTLNGKMAYSLFSKLTWEF